ncbi:MAG: LacI family transcriptional regulator [Rariglobus sp.]|jgi:DNA-binding LacI/PurR family transcriptional regulator|nr:LacI family transcriptional regulator [Rariglobus sp.]
MASSSQPESSDSSEPQPSARRVTLRDIAREVGVTPMTVSRALRNQARISAAMRDKIQAKALEMGYHPDPVLTALVHYRHSRMATPVRSAMAWFNPWPDPAQLRKYREFDFYWKGAKLAAERVGFHLEEFIVNDAMSPARMAQILYTRNVRGILLPPGLFPGGWAEQFPWDQFSVVAISRSSVGLPFHVVTSDQTSNTMLAMKKIRERGYKRIGYVGEPWIGRIYCAGYLWFQRVEIPAEHQIPPFLFHPNEDRDAVQAAFKQWVHANKPDAILTDYPRVPEMVAKLRLKVPKNIGLAGLTVLDCPIDAGIYQNPEEIGRVSVLMLQSLINDNDRGIPPVNRHVLIEGKWVDGSSMRS